MIISQIKKPQKYTVTKKLEHDSTVKLFTKKYNILILFSKWGQNSDKKLFDNKTPPLTTLKVH